MAEPEGEDVVFDICGSSRESPIVREAVPGSVAVRYRGIRFVSGTALVHQFDTNWFITYTDEAARTGLVLTVANGAEVPTQPKPTVATESHTRGTLTVTTGSTPIITGSYVVSFLQSNQNAHDVYIHTGGFDLQRLIPDLTNLKTRHPELFRRSTDRYRRRAKDMKKRGKPAAA